MLLNDCKHAFFFPELDHIINIGDKFLNKAAYVKHYWLSIQIVGVIYLID